MKITQAQVRDHYRKELDQAHLQIDTLERDKAFQSRILNSIREMLVIRTSWDGVFSKGEDLSTLVSEYLETKDVRPRCIEQLSSP